MFNVYLDDVRNGPHNGDIDPQLGIPDDWNFWIICRSVEQVKYLLLQGVVNNLSLDHDLGQDLPTGYDLLCWCEKENVWPKGDITIHSANPVGRSRMIQVLETRERNNNK